MHISHTIIARLDDIRIERPSRIRRAHRDSFREGHSTDHGSYIGDFGLEEVGGGDADGRSWVGEASGCEVCERC